MRAVMYVIQLAPNIMALALEAEIKISVNGDYAFSIGGADVNVAFQQTIV